MESVIINEIFNNKLIDFFLSFFVFVLILSKLNGLFDFVVG